MPPDPEHAPEATESVQDATPGESATTEPSDAPDVAEGLTASREAASYRHRLREVERERDALAERVAGYERREVEALASTEGAAMPADLWLLIDVAELRSEDGTLDLDRARDRIRAVLAERPSWKRAARDLGQGARPMPQPERTPALSSLLKRS